MDNLKYKKILKKMKYMNSKLYIYIFLEDIDCAYLY